MSICVYGVSKKTRTYTSVAKMSDQPNDSGRYAVFAVSATYTIRPSNVRSAANRDDGLVVLRVRRRVPLWQRILSFVVFLIIAIIMITVILTKIPQSSSGRGKNRLKITTPPITS